MKNAEHLRWPILLVAFCFWGGTLSAQSRTARRLPSLRAHTDTIFVYDTVFVTDTIKLYRPRRKSFRDQLLPIPSQTCALLVRTDPKIKNLWISPSFAATFSANNIIDSTNNIYIQNYESMKKIGFFSVVLIAFQNMILAQNQISINLGSGLHNLSVNKSEQTAMAPNFFAGLGYGRPFAKGKLCLNADLNFHFLLRSGFDNVQSFDFSRQIFYESEDFKNNYYLLNLPVSLQWNRKRFSPGVGAEYYYKNSPNITQVFNASTSYEYTTTHVIAYHGFGLLASLQTQLASRIKVRVGYFHGLTTELSSRIAGTTYKTRMRRLEIQMGYRLK